MDKHMSLLELISRHGSKMMQYAKENPPITPETVYREGLPEVQAAINELIAKFIASTSEFRHVEYVEDFARQIQAGKSGIILPEHYSNLDYPLFMYLLRSLGAFGNIVADRAVAIAGMKLTEEHPVLNLFTQGYTRINIYPSRTLAGIRDEKLLTEEKKRSGIINIAAMRALHKVCDEGGVVVVFPTGTRYRPGKPETKQGLREIDSYIRLFDIMLLISINGNCLRFSDDPKHMENDVFVPDRIIMDASPVYQTVEFRKNAQKKDCGDKKQVVVDDIMRRLEEMHIQNEKGRV